MVSHPRYDDEGASVSVFICCTVGTEWQWWNCWAKFKSENITDPEGPKTSIGNMVKCRSSLQHTFNSQTKTDRDQ